MMFKLIAFLLIVLVAHMGAVLIDIVFTEATFINYYWESGITWAVSFLFIALALAVYVFDGEDE